MSVKPGSKRKVSPDTVLTKYIIDSIAKNPLAFIPVIQAILDPKNPDSDKLQIIIAESVVKAIVSDDDMKNLCLKRVLDNIQQCTDKQIFDIVNNQRVQLEKDSKEFIRSIQRQTTVTLCENYFKTQTEKIDTIFKDYFQTISNSIQEHINALDAKTQDIVVKASKKNCVDIEVPNHMKDKVIEYMRFLDSQK